MSGTVEIVVGGNAVKPTSGAALENENDPSRMEIWFGNSGIDCNTSTENTPKGTSFTTSVPKMIGQHDASGSVWRASSTSLHVNGSDAAVTIDAIEDRVTGSVVFDTTDDEDGLITVMGTFDVVRCF